MTESSEVVRKGLSKRGFLKAAGAAALGGGIIALGYESLRHTETKIDFSTANADYRFLGGTHGDEDLGKLNLTNFLKKSDVPDDTTVFEIETGTLPYLRQDVLQILGKLYTFVREFDFWKEPIQVLTDRKLPMVLADIPPSNLDPKFIVNFSLVFPGISLAFLQRREKNPTRRKFMIGGALSLLGGVAVRTFSGEIFGFLQRSLSEPWAQKAAKLNHWVELSKPDDLPRTFRNSIIAAKNLGLEPQFPVSTQTQRPTMLMMYGSGHLALPEYMKGGKQAILDYLSLYPKAFIDKTFGLDNPHLYTSAILTPMENNKIGVETVEDRDLKDIFT